MMDPNDELLICRCEEISLREVEQAIADGAVSLHEVRRRTRAGMGLCQGRTCSVLVARLIADRTGLPLEKILPATSRPPVRPIKLGDMTGESECCHRKRK